MDFSIYTSEQTEEIRKRFVLLSQVQVQGGTVTVGTPPFRVDIDLSKHNESL